MNRKTSELTARERIMQTASELFAGQGYRATGINEVIECSGVAKATFYRHFPTKDDLCLAYLQQRNVVELGAIRAYVAGKRTPRGRFLAVAESLEPWLLETNLRGCGFLNMVAEVPDIASPLRREGSLHYTALQQDIRTVTQQLIDSDPPRYAQLDADRIVDDYMVIIAGAIALVEIHHDIQPIRHAVSMVARLID